MDKLLIVILTAALATGMTQAKEPAAALKKTGTPSAKPLNVVMIELDDCNYKTFGFMGHKFVKTPNLDKLAKQSTVFNNCIVQGTACAPSRNSLISGKYPHQTGIYMNATPTGLPENCWTFPAALRRAGVYTSFFGKDHFRPFPFRPGNHSSYKERNELVRSQLGFDHVLPTGGKVAVSNRKHGPEKDAYTKYLHGRGEGVYDALVESYGNRNGIDIFFPLDEEDYLDTFIVNSAIDWMKRGETDNKPFMLWIDLTLPHPPSDVPQKYKDMYKDVQLDPVIPIRKEGLPPSLANEMREKSDEMTYRRQYLAMQTMVDMLVGRLVDYLDESGLRENTIFFFFADQGSMIGHHGLYSKKYFYRDVINSPLIVSHPKYGKGMVIDQCVELLDISKTLVTLYGCSPEDIASTEGYDFMPLLRGEPFERKTAHAEQHGVNMIQNERFKLVSYEDGDILYDLLKDPDELVNVVNDHPEIVKMLHKRKANWLKRSGPVLPSVIDEKKAAPKRRKTPRKNPAKGGALRNNSD